MRFFPCPWSLQISCIHNIFLFFSPGNTKTEKITWGNKVKKVWFWSYLFYFVPPCYFFCFSVTGREEEEYVGNAADLKWPGAGENTHSVWEIFDLEPMCICNPKQLNCWNTRLDPISLSFLVSKKNDQSLTYIIQKILKRVPWESGDSSRHFKKSNI